MADAPPPSASAAAPNPTNPSNRASSSSSGTRRGRNGRPGQRAQNSRGSSRGRGRGASHQPSTTSDALPSEPPRSPTAASEPPHRVRRGGGRGQRRGGRGGRGGRAVQATQMAPQRTFGGRLTTAATESQDAQSLSADAPEFVPGQPVETKEQDVKPVRRRGGYSTGFAKSHATDLTTRLHEDIDNGQHECIICSNEVTRKSRIWACKLCWTVTHYQCTNKWFYSSAKVNARPQGEDAPEEDPGVKWRCPGCNSVMIEEPDSYHCWCGKEPNPRSIVGLPPHSCGQTCSKPRGKCSHPCFQQCHAGPCPPCHMMAPEQVCHCGKNTSQKPCTDPHAEEGFSCGEICDDLLPCGEHVCNKKCHPGVCGECDIEVHSSCYCGKETKDLPCGWRDVKESYSTTKDAWFDGAYACWEPCQRKFDCGVHECQKGCHPQDEDEPHCPLSPDVVTHCPCSKTPLEEISSEPRKSCSDEVPHCNKPCGKLLLCGHQCLDLCHEGDCSPCLQKADITCRCGRNTVETSCWGLPASDIPSPECRRMCKALLNCGRHQCDSHCCSGEKKALKRQAHKRKFGIEEDVEEEHICTRTCGRLLKCGKHFCQQLCHKGPCPACLEAVFTEITCSCGRTTLYPPQPCGTTMPACRFNCTRARSCGHPQVEHQCHPDDVECPKCPFLVQKPCHCGKEMLANQPCWFDKPRCGKPCGKRLKCGTHVCKQVCHRGPCEDAAVPGQRCSQTCGKPREMCGHPDTETCHAPLDCKEDKPCQSEKVLTCECARRKQRVKCLATRTEPKGPAGRAEGPKCDDECLRQKRNRQLAEALNIDPDTHTDEHIPYQDATLSYFRDHTEWAIKQEGKLREFAESPGRYLRFEPMKPAQRLFLHILAEDFGIESDSQDPEPHRFVTLHKGSLFVSAPHKTLMQSLRLWKKQQKTAASLSVTSSRPASPPSTTGGALLPYNALLLTRARFGLTAEELDAALGTELSAASASVSNAVSFSTVFLPSGEEVLLKTAAKQTIASITSGAAQPSQVESLLTNVKPKIVKAAKGLAAGVLLCHVSPETGGDGGGVVIARREGGVGNGGGAGGDGAGGAGGWSSVAGRAAAKPRAWAGTKAGFSSSSPSSSSLVLENKPNGFVALRKLGTLKKKTTTPAPTAAAAAAAATTTTTTTTTTTGTTAAAAEQPGQAQQEEQPKQEVASSDDAAAEDAELTPTPAPAVASASTSVSVSASASASASATTTPPPRPVDDDPIYDGIDMSTSDGAGGYW